MNDIYDTAAKYGVKFTGELVTSEYHDTVDYASQMTLAEVAAKGGKISRVRVLAESWGGRYMCDISYIHATLPDGKIVPVYVGVSSGALWGKGGLKSQFITWATEQKVSAKNLGLLDEGNWSILYG